MRRIVILLALILVAGCGKDGCSASDAGSTLQHKAGTYRGRPGATEPHFEKLRVETSPFGQGILINIHLDIHNPLKKFVWVKLTCVFRLDDAYEITKKLDPIYVAETSSRKIETQQSFSSSVGTQALEETTCTMKWALTKAELAK